VASARRAHACSWKKAATHSTVFRHSPRRFQSARLTRSHMWRTVVFRGQRFGLLMRSAVCWLLAAGRRGGRGRRPRQPREAWRVEYAYRPAMDVDEPFAPETRQRPRDFLAYGAKPSRQLIAGFGQGDRRAAGPLRFSHQIRRGPFGERPERQVL